MEVEKNGNSFFRKKSSTNGKIFPLKNIAVNLTSIFTPFLDKKA